MHTHANIHTTPYNRLLLRESLLICFFFLLLKVIYTESSVQIFNWNNKKSTFTTFTSKGFYNKLKFTKDYENDKTIIFPHVSHMYLCSHSYLDVMQYEANKY